MKRISLLAGAALVMAAGAAVAHGKMLEQADANKDGRITQAEVQTARADHFAKMDVNKDGFLDASELAKMSKMHDGKGGHRGHHGMGMRGERDADGKMTKSEFMAKSEGRFAEMDFNKDGVVDKTDHDARKQACESGKMLCGPMAMLDENKDSKISKDEFMSRPDRHFARMDANSDGVIDKGELAAMKAKHDHKDGAPPPAQ
ncbi:MAG: hypothetical protein ABWZ40_05170 [Caulobacterales bacterium]